MRAFWLIVLGFAVDASAASFYKHVDADGNVTYSDRPQEPGQAPISLPPSNVSTPEARRQLDLARQRWAREDREEFEIRMRQWASAQRVGPVGYSGQLSPSEPYSTYSYPPFILPTSYLNARSSRHGRSSEGLRSPGVSHHGHRPRH